MKIAIIGAGAAGCFAAANINNENGNEVAVFEKTGKVMQKVKVSGGGRCNVTNACFDVPSLLENYPRGKQLLRRIMHQFGPQQAMEWFNGRGVKLKTEEDGRVFPSSDDSQTIIDCIWGEMMRQGVKVFYHKQVSTISKNGEVFEIKFSDGTLYNAEKVLLATGGAQKASQYDWVANMGHTIQKPVPSLFTFNIPNNALTGLMGVSVPTANIKIAGIKISNTGAVLITHWGLSGPGVLKTSALAALDLANCNYNFTVLINWLGAGTEQEVRTTILNLRTDHGKQIVGGKSPFGLPRRLWDYFLEQCCIEPETKWGELLAAAQNKLINKLILDKFEVKGKSTFKEEFVTCGGVSISEIDPKTMESRKMKGLYFAGELMDVDGVTGGFNFQNAWASAWVAAKNIAQ